MSIVWFFRRKAKKKKATWSYDEYARGLNSTYLDPRYDDESLAEEYDDWIEDLDNSSIEAQEKIHPTRADVRPRVSSNDLNVDEKYYFDHDENLNQNIEDRFPGLPSIASLQNNRRITDHREYNSAYPVEPEHADARIQSDQLSLYPIRKNNPDDPSVQDTATDAQEKIISIQWRIIQHLPFLCLVFITLIKITTTARDIPLSVKESYNWFLTTQTLNEIWSQAHSLGTSPYYITFQKFIISVLGDSLIDLRTSSIIFYTLGMFLIYAFGSLRLNREIGLTFATFFAFSTFILDQATSSDTAIIISVLAILYLILSIEAVQYTRRHVLILSIVTALIMIQIQPISVVYIGAVVVGFFFDSISTKVRQFQSFAIWSFGQFMAVALAIFLAWPFIVYRLSIAAFFNEFSEKISTSVNILFPNSYFVIPIVLGSLLALRLVSHPITLKPKNPVILGASLFTSSLIPFLVSFGLQTDQIAEIGPYLFGPALASLIVISGFGLSQILNRIPLQLGFLTLLFAMSSAFLLQFEDSKSISTKSALDSYNNSKAAAECVLVYPEKYQYAVWYGLTQPPSCFAPVTQIDQIDMLIRDKKSTSIFFFVSENGDGSIFRSLNEKLNRNWKIESERHGKIILLNLSKK